MKRSLLLLALASCALNTEEKPPAVQDDFVEPAALFGGDATQAATPPQPMFGGGLLLTQTHAIHADPDQGFVDALANFKNPAPYGPQNVHFTLGKGSVPWRMTELNGVVYAVLRGAGELVTLDLKTQATSRRSICAAPRG